MEEAILEKEGIYDGDVEKDFDFFAGKTRAAIMNHLSTSKNLTLNKDFRRHEMSCEHSLRHIRKWRLLRVTTGRCLGCSLAQEI